MDAKTMGEVANIVAAANRSEIHRKTGISLSGVSRILSGGREAKTHNLEKVALALGVSMDILFPYLMVLRAQRLKRQKRRERRQHKTVAA